MNRTLIITIAFLTSVLVIDCNAQKLHEFVVKREGVEPIILSVDSISIADMHRGVLTWAKANIGDSSVTEVEGKSFAVKHVWKNLLTTHLKTGMFSLDMDFTLGITPGDKQLTISFTPTQFWIAGGQGKKADFSYDDMFKKNGEVTFNGLSGRDRLQINLNNLISHLTSYLKKNYIIRLKENKFEKGYVKEGKRISVWQYFDGNGNLELSINYLTGRILYLRPDTSRRVALTKQNWSSQKLDISPIPLSGTHNFYENVKEVVSSSSASCLSNEGKMLFAFEVDSLGMMTKQSLVKGFGSRCDSVILQAFKSLDTRWVPAKIGKSRVRTRFVISIIFEADDQAVIQNPPCRNDTTNCLSSVIVSPKKKTFTFVEKSAEPVDGLETFYKWVDKNLRYPESARQRGIEGKTFVKFVIEPSGDITNVEKAKGFNDDCDKEAVRLMSTAPKWKPGTQRGIPVRQAYTLPIAFKLAN